MNDAQCRRRVKKYLRKYLRELKRKMLVQAGPEWDVDWSGHTSEDGFLKMVTHRMSEWGDEEVQQGVTPEHRAQLLFGACLIAEYDARRQEWFPDVPNKSRQD